MTVPPVLKSHSALLAIMLVVLAIVVTISGVVLTVTGHSASDAWWIDGIIVSGVVGIHVPTPGS